MLNYIIDDPNNEIIVESMNSDSQWHSDSDHFSSSISSSDTNKPDIIKQIKKMKK
jgi:hypothetical protein